jgi:hypothetical protein
LREEHRLRVFENRVLRRIFGPKREEDGSWRKLYTDELGIDRKITSRWTLVRYGSMGRTGFGWLKTGSGGGLL